MTTQTQESSAHLLDNVDMPSEKRASAKMRMQRCETLVDGMLNLFGRKTAKRHQARAVSQAQTA